jgi:hypothetical protein
MLVSEQKPIEEILRYLDEENNVFLVGCKGCAEGFESGGEPQVMEMKQKLEQEGKTVTGFALIDMVCNQSLTRMKLIPYKQVIDTSDAFLVLTCGSGVQSLSSVVDKLVYPGCNTISSVGGHAEWKEAERCLECGDCVLAYTGGICPIARCSKSMSNGPCGGSEGGQCEVNPGIDCAWHLIVERLSKLGRLDKLETVIPPKDWSVSLTGGPPRHY